MVCEYGKADKYSIICQHDLMSCGFYRWCNTIKGVKMLPNYTSCRLRRDMKEKEISKKQIEKELENEELEIETPKDEDVNNGSKRNKGKSKKCKIILLKKEMAIVEFIDGYNLMVINEHKKEVGEYITIRYIGTYGKKTFKII